MILTDIKMPVMDGLELARRAKELFPEIRIVIFSGYNDFTFAQEAIRYGVTDYILKPVDPDNFHEIIEKAEKNIRERQAEENREIRRQNFLQQYFLQNYLYSGKKRSWKKPGSLSILTNGTDGTAPY